ncbi:histone transcription regulator HIRA, WD repeat superfamily [Cryomyces antarcticus]
MRFIKPLWLTHGGDKKDYEAYSCHVSPDGNRLVTAAGDGHVRIWSTEAIYAQGEYKKPKQLAALSYHSGTIHTVRFSGNNKYLASGADDKILCVYNLDPNPPTHTTFGSNEVPPAENWRIFRRLIGHDNDIQDLGWSYDSSILVSVGLDSKVVVWSGYTFEKLKKISQHQSHVKGITFDPANKYFATASDDRTIKIFRFTSPAANATAHDQAGNFILEKSIAAPFTTSPLTTYFRRCSWSPEGNHIAAANAVNGPVSSVAIINRGSWESEINLIGHEGPVEVCAFSPRLFCKEPTTRANVDAKGHTVQHSVTVVACAGHDKTLSVWNTSFPRPFVVTAELTAKSITDLAWTPDGETLFLSSLDGTIAAAKFEVGELGYPAPLQDNEKSLSKYGAGRRVGVIEGTDALLLEESSKAGELKGVQGRMGALMGDGGSTNDVTVNGNAGGVHTNGTSNDTPAAVAADAADGATAGQASTTAHGTVTDPNNARLERLKSRITITKDGKKRIAPLLVSNSSGLAESTLPRPQLMTGAAQGTKIDAPQTIIDLSKPYDGLPKGGLAALIFGNKRKYAEVEGDEERRMERRVATAGRNGAVPIVENGPEGLTLPKASKAPDETEVPAALRPAIVDPSLAISQLRLAVPMVRSIILRPVGGVGNTAVDGSDAQRTEGQDEEAIVLETRNASGPSRTGRPQDKEPTRISATRRGQALWQDFLPRSALLVTGNHNFWAVGCEDGSIYVWTPAGRRLLNALILEAQPVILDCRGWWLMCVTAVGTCRVWNIKTLSSPHPPVSLAPVLNIASANQGPHLTNAPSLVFARLNSQGRIIVAMSNGDGFTYTPSLHIWQRLSESWWAVGSQYWNTTDSSVGNLHSAPRLSKAADEDNDLNLENVSAGIIPLLERNTTTQTLVRGRAYYLQRLVKSLLSAEGFEGFESSVSIAHLENRVAAAMTLGAKEEFRLHLLVYAKRLGAEGLKGKIQELLRSLLGKVFDGEDRAMSDATEAGQGWETEGRELCGWDREELLKEVVVILGKHRDLQRITVTYARYLGVVDGQSGDQNGIMDL